MKWAENSESMMFSFKENCCRIPPHDSTVDAWEYCRKRNIKMFCNYLLLILALKYYKMQKNKRIEVFSDHSCITINEWINRSFIEILIILLYIQAMLYLVLCFLFINH